jgi:hypothetical protein
MKNPSQATVYGFQFEIRGRLYHMTVRRLFKIFSYEFALIHLEKVDMKVPEQTHSGNLNRTKADGPQAVEGVRTPAGKTAECDSAIKDAKKYVPSAVTTVSNDANKGKALECVEQQNGGNMIPATRKTEDKIAAARERNEGADSDADDK